MKTQKYLLISFIIMAFCLFSCVPNAENATNGHQSGSYIFIGFWHGIIVPFSLLGKLVGLPIGILDRGKISDLTYIVGYAYALYLYSTILKPLVTYVWSHLKEKRY